MSIIFGLVGWYHDPDYQRRVAWPVVVRFVEQEIIDAKTLCDGQRDELVSKLRVIWADMKSRRQELRRLTLQRSAGGLQHLAYQTRTGIISRLERQLEELQAGEAKLCREHGENGFDPLFPSASNGRIPEVTYEIVNLPEDPRELGQKEILRLRIELHAIGQDDEAEEDIPF